MLMSSIREDRVDRNKLIEAVLSKLTLFINPELFYKELEIKKGTHSNTYRTNTLFAQQSASARATGKPQSPEYMKQAIAKMYENKRKKGMATSSFTSPVVTADADIIG
jgi:hypothetical protein